MDNALPAKTVIGLLDCPDCGSTLPVLTNKNGDAYCTCYTPDLKTAEKCNHHRRWGKAKSSEMRTAFIAAKAPKKAPTHDTTPTAPGTDVQPRKDEKRDGWSIDY